MNMPRSQFVAAVATDGNNDDIIVVVGGMQGCFVVQLVHNVFIVDKTLLNSVEVFSTMTNKWVLGAQMSNALFDHAGVTNPVDNTTVIVCGGTRDGGSVVSDCLIYYVVTNKWGNFTSMPVPLSGRFS